MANSDYPGNTVIGIPFVVQHTQYPVLSYAGLMAITEILSSEELPVLPRYGPDKPTAMQAVASSFIERTDAEWLVMLEPELRVPIDGIGELAGKYEGQGVLTALAFWWPDARHNILMEAGKERKGGYTWRRYMPDQGLVGRWAVENYEGYKGGFAVIAGDDEPVDVRYFSEGLFIVSRNTLEKVGEVPFHTRKGYYMANFCDKARSLRLPVKAALNIVCSSGGVNHVDFLKLYGREKDALL